MTFFDRSIWYNDAGDVEACNEVCFCLQKMAAVSRNFMQFRLLQFEAYLNVEGGRQCGSGG